MDLDDLFKIYSDLVRIDRWPTVPVDPGHVKTTLEYSRFASRLPEDYRKFINSGIVEILCGWQLFGVTVDSMSLEEANSNKLWRNNLPERYTLFGTAGGEDCWFFFDHEPEDDGPGPIIVFDQWPNLDFPANKLMHCADNFTSLLFDVIAHRIERSSLDISRDLKKLSGQHDLISDTGHGPPSDDDVAGTIRWFSRVLEGEEQTGPCRFLSAHRLQRYAGGGVSIPRSYRLMEYTLTQPEYASDHVQFVESVGGHVAKLITRSRRQVSAAKMGPGSNLLVFGVINDADYFAFDMEDPQITKEWPVYLIKLAEDNRPEKPILWARSHYESLVKIIMDQLQARRQCYQSFEDRLALL